MAQYSAVNGQALQISALRNLQEILDIQYQMYDGFGNILLEHMQNGAATPDMGDKGGSHNYSEYFVYDDLHRLTHSSFNSFNGTGLDYTYDSGGNLLSKSDYARNYDYTTGTSGGPNAVKRVEKILKQQDGTTQYQWANFSYDARGNMTSGDGLSQAIYNAMDKPTYIEKGGATLSFAYGPSHMRYRQIKVKENITTTTHYVGKLFEKEYREENGVTRESWRAYIGSTAVVSQDDSDGFAIRYQHRDRLGSARTFTDEAGSVVARRDYDPFGKPRMPDGTLKEDHWMAGVPMEPILDDLDSAKTPRGFTDHEHLDSVQYIHMNGRVYDYNLGRFLSVDPYIQSPGNSQSINPYSYIMNNPLAGTDPTGYVVRELPPSTNQDDMIDESATYNVEFDVEGGGTKIVSMTGAQLNKVSGMLAKEGKAGLKLSNGGGKEAGGVPTTLTTEGGGNSAGSTSDLGGSSHVQSLKPGAYHGQNDADGTENMTIVGQTSASTTIIYGARMLTLDMIKGAGTRLYGMSTAAARVLVTGQAAGFLLLMGLPANMQIGDDGMEPPGELPYDMRGPTGGMVSSGSPGGMGEDPDDDEFQQSDFVPTDRLGPKAYRNLVKDISKNGLKNTEIKYVVEDGVPYVVHGSNRLNAARHLGITDQLKFTRVNLPFKNYVSAKDLTRVPPPKLHGSSIRMQK
ncbi:RHS repeat-associated core domain-containing protein [Teredinibacter sp. KSP-S5-2]|uniref:RHS repeat domain-containing protein n=1 Tax=Teredinibacter sp. KSP-S5-2 TaxID=3034506 RepID=UPI0029341777|nr:RHS repeat-associated core domain-containing protein [Teredinibacter sp. KSP-S5-2]WNO10289.1 RHS repeat-associated core domain-containing protein [Teredinibacter sp. KSP-S5-2]